MTWSTDPLTPQVIKWVKSLHKKRQRLADRLVIVEGERSVRAYLESGLVCEALFTQLDYDLRKLLPHSIRQPNALYHVGEKDLLRISLLASPSPVMAVFQDLLPANRIGNDSDLDLFICDLADPGNLGTLIRCAHWFGLKQIGITPATVESSNPKVVQASMGSTAFVQTYIKDPVAAIQDYRETKGGTVCALDLDGQSIDQFDRGVSAPNGVMLLLGSESHGLPTKVKSMVDITLTIPPYSTDFKPDSLNATLAAAIVMSRLRHSDVRSASR